MVTKAEKPIDRVRAHRESGNRSHPGYPEPNERHPMNKTIGYKVIDTITGDMLGVWHSVSERGAKVQAAKARNTEFRYLAATPYVEEVQEVPVFEFEGSETQTETSGWVEVEYGDESDHWCKTFGYMEVADVQALQAIAHSIIGAGHAHHSNITVVLCTPWATEAGTAAGSMDESWEAYAARAYTNEFGSVDTRPESVQAAEYRATYAPALTIGAFDDVDF